uniref:Uncharacterized protein n=1 Tax=Romanomermis culicivorax TaxID=13658 RepID=A0A915KN64_ROMCU
MQQQITGAQGIDLTVHQTPKKLPFISKFPLIYPHTCELKLFSPDMQSRTGASHGSKRPYDDPILPMHNRTKQSYRHFHNIEINGKRIAQFLHFDRYFESTFNCLVSIVYAPIRVNNNMVLQCIQ